MAEPTVTVVMAKYESHEVNKTHGSVHGDPTVLITEVQMRCGMKRTLRCGVIVKSQWCSHSKGVLLRNRLGCVRLLALKRDEPLESLDRVEQDLIDRLNDREGGGIFLGRE